MSAKAVEFHVNSEQMKFYLSLISYQKDRIPVKEEEVSLVEDIVRAAKTTLRELAHQLEQYKPLKVGRLGNREVRLLAGSCLNEKGEKIVVNEDYARTGKEAIEKISKEIEDIFLDFCLHASSFTHPSESNDASLVYVNWGEVHTIKQQLDATCQSYLKEFNILFDFYEGRIK